MSHHICEHCGATCYDSPTGYVTGCEHYPTEMPQKTEDHIDLLVELTQALMEDNK